MATEEAKCTAAEKEAAVVAEDATRATQDAACEAADDNVSRAALDAAPEEVAITL